jgi:hypothetical protein
VVWFEFDHDFLQVVGRRLWAGTVLPRPLAALAYRCDQHFAFQNDKVVSPTLSFDPKRRSSTVGPGGTRLCDRDEW